MALSVSMSHLVVSGRLFSGTVAIWLFLKPIIESLGDLASTEGSSVKLLLDKNKIFKFFSFPKSSGNLESLLSVISKTSKVSAKSKSAGGNDVSPHASFMCVVPASLPLFSASNVFNILLPTPCHRKA